MVDIDKMGGIQVIVKNLLDAGLLNGDTLTCTGETLSQQVNRLSPSNPDGNVIYSVKKPFKKTGGLRLLGGNLSPEFSAILKLAGVEGVLENGIFKGKAKVYDSEQEANLGIQKGEVKKGDVVVIRYEGPKGGPGMPEMLKPTAAIIGAGLGKDVALTVSYTHLRAHETS